MERNNHSRAFARMACRTVLVCGLAWGGLQQAAADTTVGRLRTDAVENPIGLDSENPLFSWTMDAGDERGVMQTAYEIAVYSDADHGEQIWSSGRVESEQQKDVAYDGNSLSPSTRYYWAVTVWDNKGNEATSTEDAYFETGLMGSGWSGATWIKATDTLLNPADDDADAITHYVVETDFEIANISAGVIFAGADQSHYFMWQINLEYGYPRFRPHIWRGSTVSDAECLADINLTSLVNVQQDQSYHLRIEVDGDVATTYIDDVLIDTRTNPDGGNYTYGVLGIREDRAEFNYNNLEKAYFDNFTVTNLTDDVEEVLVSEDFSGTDNLFTNSTITDGRLYVEAAYAWYTPATATVVYDLDMDFYIERECAGIVFSAYDTDNLHMWSVNVKDSSTPFLRRHIKTNGSYTYADTDMGSYFTKAELTGSLHHIKIAVNGTTIITYIDGQQVDTYEDTSGALHNGYIGFRTYHDTSINEMAYYDNVVVTTYESDASDEGVVTFSEDFEGAGHAFTDGVVCTLEGSKMLCVSSTYEENCALQVSSLEGIPMFRKAFTAQSGVKSAKVYATSLGVFDLFVNGNRAGQVDTDGNISYSEMKPGWTDYRKEINYMTFDVTQFITEGDNVIGAQVSNGWWGGAIAHDVYGTPDLGFLAKLYIVYEDGSEETIVTGTDWASSTCGPVLYGDIYNGETYDARRECDWTTPDYDASGWYATAENTDFSGSITALIGQPVRIRENLRRTPQTITVYEGIDDTGSTYGTVHVTRTLDGTSSLSLKAGETALYDLGQNMVGWIRFTAQGEAGTRLRFKFGEMLNDTGESDRANDGPGGSLYTYNLRTAEATLNYTMKGTEGGETFQPSTTFFGFRYCEVIASSDVEITALTGEVVGSDIEETATFETSHADVNQLYSNILWGQRGNFLSIPTDCPQRDERLGWTADTQIFAPAACYNADTRAFYHKWMRDLRLSQRDDGAYPDMAPYCNFWGYGNAAWGDAGVIVPYTVFFLFGDYGIIEENYESMTKYMDWLATQSGDGYTYNGSGTGMGDWLAYETTEARYVSVCYYAYVARLMARMAEAMHNETDIDSYATDAENYETLYEQIKAEYQERYLDSDGQPTVSTQTSYLLALQMDLLPESAVETAVETLRDKIADNGYKLSTGFVGTGLLNQTLSGVGLDDIAFDLLLQRENPSWLYSVDQGATTVWERWDSYTKESGFNKHEWIMNSFNHYSYGAVAAWMFNRMAGIEADLTQPGFKHIIFQPSPDFRDEFPDGQERITSVKASHQSGYGLVGCEWQYKDDGRISCTVTVPANTTATLYLPVKDSTDVVTESGKALDEAEGLTYTGMSDGKAVMELSSGTYVFDIAEGEAESVSTTTRQPLRITPNPFHNSLNVECDDEDITRVNVASTSGQVVYSQSEGGEINASSWTPGVYVVHVTTTGQTYSGKAIKK